MSAYDSAALPKGYPCKKRIKKKHKTRKSQNTKFLDLCFGTFSCFLIFVFS